MGKGSMQAVFAAGLKCDDGTQARQVFTLQKIIQIS
jgi:hypothetical protein